MTDQPRETVEGEVVATRDIEHQDSEFRRNVINSLSVRGLEGGTYALVKVSDDPATDPDHENVIDESDRSEALDRLEMAMKAVADDDVGSAELQLQHAHARLGGDEGGLYRRLDSAPDGVDSTSVVEAFAVRCKLGHKSVIERVDWPSQATQPHSCPACGRPLRSHQIDPNTDGDNPDE